MACGVLLMFPRISPGVRFSFLPVICFLRCVECNVVVFRIQLAVYLRFVASIFGRGVSA